MDFMSTNSMVSKIRLSTRTESQRPSRSWKLLLQRRLISQRLWMIGSVVSCRCSLHWTRKFSVIVSIIASLAVGAYIYRLLLYSSSRVHMKGTGKYEASSSKIVFEDSEEDEELSCSSVSSSDEEEETGKELTFEEIHKLRADGSKAVPWKPNQVKKTSRANKNRPMELSSKKPVSRFQEVVQVPKKVVRDPRFDALGGKLDLEGFRKRYNFFFEDKLPVEREELKKQLKKTKNPEQVNKLKNELTYVEKMLKYEPSMKNRGAAILTEHKKKEREAAKEGKKPYYLKKSEIRKQTLLEKYNSLKESGKLSSFLDKKRKKNATKDQRYMPYRRTEE